MEGIEVLAKYAGIGGIAIGCASLVFKDFLKSKYFSNVTGDQTYKLFRLLLYIVWSIAVLGVISYLIISISNDSDIPPGDTVGEVVEFEPVIYFGTLWDPENERNYPDCRKTIFTETQFQEIVEWLLKFDGQIREIRLHAGVEDRGTREYNLALAEHCGRFVASWLEDVGIDRTTISVLSYGEERSMTIDKISKDSVKSHNTYVAFEIR